MNPFRSWSTLSPAPPGLADFWATVHVKFREPIHNIDDPTEMPAQGYYRSFGLRSTPSGLQDILMAEVQDGMVEWEDSEWHLIDIRSLDTELRKYVKLPPGEGVW